MASGPLLRTAIPGIPCRRGKVRDAYDLGEQLLLVATDRISAFDWVLPTPIPDKGTLLTRLTRFWLDHLGVANHLIEDRLEQLPEPFCRHPELAGRAMLCRKLRIVPIECVVRGYLAGSGWKEYRHSGTVCGQRLTEGLRQGERLPGPIFTPATKEETGHDINISVEDMAQRVGHDLTAELARRSIDVYQKAASHAAGRGILLADTKLEWGQTSDGVLLLADEVLTPDSSRFWPLDGYRVGESPPSFDKQFVRDWLEQSGWDKQSPPPQLPADVVGRTRAKYVEAYERLTGSPFSA